MCGRYAYYSSKEILQHYKLQANEQLQLALEVSDNYNVSPSNHMPVIIRGDQEHQMEFMVWGLIPAWSKSSESPLKLINARKENLLEKPMWKRLVNSNRCIVPARGFYEWETLQGRKYPFYITLKDSEVISFAGLWDEWHDSEGIVISSYTIITTTPNQEMSDIHNRMPAILGDQQAKIWLNPTALSKELLDDLLEPAPDGSLNIAKVSNKVNNTRNNSSDLIYPLE